MRPAVASAGGRDASFEGFQPLRRRSSSLSSGAGGPAGSGGPSYGWAAAGSGYVSGAAGGLTSFSAAIPPAGVSQCVAGRSRHDDEAPLGRPRHLHCADRYVFSPANATVYYVDATLTTFILTFCSLHVYNLCTISTPCAQVPVT